MDPKARIVQMDDGTYVGFVTIGDRDYPNGGIASPDPLEVKERLDAYVAKVKDRRVLSARDLRALRDRPDVEGPF